jgi:hypothetical protein
LIIVCISGLVIGSVVSVAHPSAASWLGYPVGAMHVLDISSMLGVWGFDSNMGRGPSAAADLCCEQLLLLAMCCSLPCIRQPMQSLGNWRLAVCFLTVSTE